MLAERLALERQENQVRKKAQEKVSYDSLKTRHQYQYPARVRLETSI